MNLRRKPKEVKNVKILVFDTIEIQNKVKYLQLKSIISFLDKKGDRKGTYPDCW
jgi:hypothetical protein